MGIRIITFITVSLMLITGERLWAKEYTCESPDKSTVVRVFVGPEKLEFQIEYKGQVISGPNQLSWKVDSIDICRNIGPGQSEYREGTIASTGCGGINQYQTYRELSVPIQQKESELIYIAIFRAYNDGVAFKLRFPSRTPHLVQGEQQDWKWASNVAYLRSDKAEKNLPLGVQLENMDLFLWIDEHRSRIFPPMEYDLQMGCHLEHAQTFIIKQDTTFETVWHSVWIGENPLRATYEHLPRKLDVPKSGNIRGFKRVSGIAANLEYQDLTQLGRQLDSLAIWQIPHFIIPKVDSTSSINQEAYEAQIATIAREKKLFAWIRRSAIDFKSQTQRMKLLLGMKQKGLRGIVLSGLDKQDLLREEIIAITAQLGVMLYFEDDLVKANDYETYEHIMGEAYPLSNTDKKNATFALLSQGDPTCNSLAMHQLCLKMMSASGINIMDYGKVQSIFSQLDPGKIPTCWEDTRVLSNSQDKILSVARLSEGKWYVFIANLVQEDITYSLITDFPSLSFYQGSLLSDLVDEKRLVVKEEFVFRQGETIDIPLCSGGGAMLQFEKVKSRPVRINSNVELIADSFDGQISLEAGGEIHYTLDGSEPAIESPVYTEPITPTEDNGVKAAIIDDKGNYLAYKVIPRI